MRLGVNVARLLLVAILIVTWQLGAYIGLINVHLVSSPDNIAKQLWLIISGHSDVIDFYSYLYATITELLVAYSCVIVIGVPLGILIGSNKFLGMTFEPLIIAFFSIPSIVLYPVIYLMLGFGMLSKIVFGIVVGLFVVVENSAAGTKQINKEMLRLGSSLGFNKFQILRKMVLPSALPSIVTGLRLGISMTLIGIIAGEIIASNVGLGLLITNSFSLFRTADLMALVAVVIGISTIGNVSLAIIENKINKLRTMGIGN